MCIRKSYLFSLIILNYNSLLNENFEMNKVKLYIIVLNALIKKLTFN